MGVTPSQEATQSYDWSSTLCALKQILYCKSAEPLSEFSTNAANSNVVTINYEIFKFSQIIK